MSHVKLVRMETLEKRERSDAERERSFLIVILFFVEEESVVFVLSPTVFSPSLLSPLSLLSPTLPPLLREGRGSHSLLSVRARERG
jgi:hypothetical protein